MSKLARYREHFVSAALVVAAGAVFGQVRGHGFVSFDDGLYVYQNPIVLQGLSLHGVAWAFGTFAAVNWHPLTWLSHMLDVSLFGLDPGSHHLVNVALHAANAALLFHLLRTATGDLPRSALVAALFCVHPLHVESVAWIAERKDLLSTLFGFLAMLAYLRAVQRGSRAWTLVALLAFALSLLAKPMLVTLPFVLLLLDWWPLQRTGWRRLLLEKLPWLALSAVFSAVTIAAQGGGGAMASLQNAPLWLRAGNAAIAYGDYLSKTVWPAGLSYFYPVETEALGWRVLAALAVIAPVSIAAILLARRKPSLAVGWFWYLGTLIPVIGIVQVGLQAMADRYTYFPLIGVFVAMAWLVPDRILRTRAFALASVVCLAALAVASWFQTKYWRNGVSLNQHALAVDPENWAALANLGGELLLRGEPAQAANLLAESLRLRPDNALAYAGLGMALEQQGKRSEAIEVLRRAVSLQQGNAAMYYDLGRLLRETGRAREAVDALHKAVELNANDPGGHYQLGLALAELGHSRESSAELEAARRLAPREPVPGGPLPTRP